MEVDAIASPVLTQQLPGTTSAAGNTGNRKLWGDGLRKLVVSIQTSGGCGNPQIVLSDRRFVTSKIFSPRPDRPEFLAGSAGIRHVSDCKCGCIHPT